MAEFPALPLFTDAYLADTRHLSTEEHGAYLLLMMEAWRRPECSLPDDDEMLARLAGMSAGKWAAMKPVIMAFWRRDGRRRVWVQSRLEKERLYVAQKSRSQRDKVLKRWNKKNNVNTPVIPDGYPDDTPTPTPTVKKKPSVSKKARFPADWQIGPEEIAYAAEHDFSDRQAKAIFERFRDHHIGKGSTMADWQAAWRTWVRNEIAFGKVKPEGSSKPAAGSPHGWPPEIPAPDRSRDMWLRGLWPAPWGPEPGKPGCRIPESIQTEWLSEKSESLKQNIAARTA